MRARTASTGHRHWDQPQWQFGPLISRPAPGSAPLSGMVADMTTSDPITAADPAAIRSAADALAALRGPITSALDDAQAELTAAQAQPLPPGTRPSPALAALAEMVPAMAAEAATVADDLDRIADELRHDADDAEAVEGEGQP